MTLPHASLTDALVPVVRVSRRDNLAEPPIQLTLLTFELNVMPLSVEYVVELPVYSLGGLWFIYTVSEPQPATVTVPVIVRDVVPVYPVIVLGDQLMLKSEV